MIDLRLIVITDARLAEPREIESVVEEAVKAGAPAVQLRDKAASPRALFDKAVRLREITRKHNALLFINDRLDIALAAGADGVHLGPDDIPIALARKSAQRPFLIGTSTDDPERARRMQNDGADYIGCGAVFGTTSKDVGGERIGVERLREVVTAVDVPVVGIGGVDENNVSQIAASGAAGAAVIRALMQSEDVARTVALLLAPF
ncbi:MAG TPA: thiamine phosphate synthase [Longimicrobiales bacterium]|nr:thiamine phosphate synthase [Longimicrobiales bacterium]